MKCTRVLRRVTSGAFKYSLANSRARLSALPFGTTSATTPHSYPVLAVSGCGFSRNVSSRQNYYFVRAILGDPVKGVHKFCMVLRGEGEGSAVTVKFGNQDTFGVPSQF